MNGFLQWLVEGYVLDVQERSAQEWSMIIYNLLSHQEELR